jgi:hypothetical protein
VAEHQQAAGMAACGGQQTPVVRVAAHHAMQHHDFGRLDGVRAPGTSCTADRAWVCGGYDRRESKGGLAMDVYSITQAGVERRSADELKVLLEQPDALIWVDMPICLKQDAAVLLDLFGFHELAVRDCVERNHISKIHFYDDHVFTVLHAPELGSGGHVHPPQH